jgi:hypothetical protein
MSDQLAIVRQPDDVACLGGALFPYNWLRPRVRWTAPADQTAFEVRISAPGEKNDYVVYTTNHYWALDKTTWTTIAGIEGGAKGTLVGVPISVTGRGTSAAGWTATISNTAQFEIAPASVDGTMLYMTAAASAIDATSTNLQGFRVGDEGTTTALTAPEVQQYKGSGQSRQTAGTMGTRLRSGWNVESGAKAKRPRHKRYTSPRMATDETVYPACAFFVATLVARSEPAPGPPLVLAAR